MCNNKYTFKYLIIEQRNCQQVCLRVRLQLHAVSYFMYVFTIFRCTDSQAKYNEFLIGICVVHQSEDARSYIQGAQIRLLNRKRRRTHDIKKSSPTSKLDKFSSQSRKHFQATSFHELNVYFNISIKTNWSIS